MTLIFILRDLAGNLLASERRHHGTNSQTSQLNFNPSYTGTYYIDVGAWNEQYDGNLYQVSVQPYTLPPLAPTTRSQISWLWLLGRREPAFQRHSGRHDHRQHQHAERRRAESRPHRASEWTDIIGVRFQEVTTGRPNILRQYRGPGAVAATDCHYSRTGSPPCARPHLHRLGEPLRNVASNSYSLQTYIHEIGHALGLGHAGNYNGTADYPYDALFQNDAWSTSIMSYFDRSENTYFANQGFSRRFRAHADGGGHSRDADAVWAVDDDTNRRHDLRFQFNAGGVYNASALSQRRLHDLRQRRHTTRSISRASAANQVINLNPETFSNVNGNTGNLSIARGVVIENATAAAAADTIVGNAADNVLKGGARHRHC